MRIIESGATCTGPRPSGGRNSRRITLFQAGGGTRVRTPNPRATSRSWVAYVLAAWPKSVCFRNDELVEQVCFIIFTHSSTRDALRPSSWIWPFGHLPIPPFKNTISINGERGRKFSPLTFPATWYLVVTTHSYSVLILCICPDAAAQAHLSCSSQ